MQKSLYWILRYLSFRLKNSTLICPNRLSNGKYFWNIKASIQPKADFTFSSRIEREWYNDLNVWQQARYVILKILVGSIYKKSSRHNKWETHWILVDETQQLLSSRINLNLTQKTLIQVDLPRKQNHSPSGFNVVHTATAAAARTVQNAAGLLLGNGCTARTTFE